ncbi:MAG TPA: acyl-CoA dehydrogenase family protein [Burkholderiaceae bacterium]|nr:acyl-CoA dehydrogenase family protein [Burkholderiaceae bacterium]
MNSVTAGPLAAAFVPWTAGRVRPVRSADELHARAAELLPQIAEGAAARERDRELPYRWIRRIAEAGLYTFRVPERFGGPGGSVRDVIRFVIDLAAVDSNAAQALRPAYGFVEGLLFADDADSLARWLPKVLAGEIFGNAGWERGGPNGQITARLRREGDRLRVSGTKFYSTGALFADWITSFALDEDDREVAFTVPRDRPGLRLVDDFDAIGQRLTASGTTVYEAVEVQPHELRPGAQRDRRTPIPPFYQLFLAAVEAGIARNALADAVHFARHHARPIKHSSASRSVDDPYVQEAVGEIAAAAYGAEATVLRAADALDAAWRGGLPEALLTAASIEVAQAQFLAVQLALKAGEQLFDVGGASTTLREHNLDRHWRNARTVANHNPRQWKAAAVGNFLLTGTQPPTTGLF